MLKTTKWIAAWFLSVLLFTGACSAPATQSAPPQSPPVKDMTYTDPFEYCAAIGTIDAPDLRYAGPAMPDSIVKGLVEQGVITADTPADIQKHAVWRCMNSQVWACHFGANIPCEEKADTSKTPSAAMADFCQANPDSIGIPAAVTGRATVYEWKCNASTPEVVKQLTQVDPQGYLAIFWHQLTPK